ncbi:MAG: AgmX/PglI C-terminal domain-containing protein [Polyangiales bacterium]
MRTLAYTAVSLAALLGACTFNARNPDRYREDTRAVLSERTPQIQSCYDNHLQGDAAAAGDVVVNFTVEKKTGVFKDVVVNPDGTTAPEPLAQCVVQSLAGLRLAPEDARDGLATFTWTFTPPTQG